MDFAFIGVIDLRNQLQQRRLATAITPDDAEELSLMNFETDVLKHRLLFIALDAPGPVDNGLLQASRLLRRQLEALGDMRRRKNDRVLGVIEFY